MYFGATIIAAKLFCKTLMFLFIIGAFFNNLKDFLGLLRHFLKPLCLRTVYQLRVISLSHNLTEIGGPEVSVEV